MQDYFLCRTPYMPIDDFPKPSELRIGSDFFGRVGTLFMIIQPQLIADPNRCDDYIGSSPCFSLSENLPYVPLRIVRSFGADDKTSCLLATVYSLIPKYVVCCIAFGCSFTHTANAWTRSAVSSLDALQVSQGFGKHVGHLTVRQQIEIWKWNFALQFAVLVGTALSEISVSFLLLRLLGISASLMQRYILLSINFFVATGTFIIIINDDIACRPSPEYWHSKLSSACQHSVHVLGYFQGGFLSSYFHSELGDFAH